jgi:hypothetical protein
VTINGHSTHFGAASKSFSRTVPSSSPARLSDLKTCRTLALRKGPAHESQFPCARVSALWRTHSAWSFICTAVNGGNVKMSTILIVLLVLFLLGGGGWGYSRWRG